MTDATQLTLNLRRQRLKRDAANRAYWETVMSPKTVLAARTAILICDVWDDHWSRGAAERIVTCSLTLPRLRVASTRTLSPVRRSRFFRKKT